MKEFLKSIDREDYHKVVYPALIRREIVGQLTLDGEILFLANPEKYPPKYADPPQEPQIIKANGIQAQFHPFGSWKPYER